MWFGEHHALTEYSHMSAPEVVMGYVAARTERIHLASGIVSFPTVKEHPVRLAERSAMLDHITGGRYEFGTGRGAGQPRGGVVQRAHHVGDQVDVERGDP